MAVNGRRKGSYCLECQRFIADDNYFSHESSNPTHTIIDKEVSAERYTSELSTHSSSTLRVNSMCQFDLQSGVSLDTTVQYMPIISGSEIETGFINYQAVSGSTAINIPASGLYKVSWSISGQIADSVIAVNRKVLSSSLRKNGIVMPETEINDYGRSNDGGGVSVAGEYLIECESDNTSIGIYSENNGGTGGVYTSTGGTLKIELIEKW